MKRQECSERSPIPPGVRILQDLQGVELTAGDIASRFTITAPSVSRHLGVLRSAGLVIERREGNRVFYSLVEDRLALCVGQFLSIVCPEQVVLRQRRKRQPAQPAEKRGESR